ncbi:hypothetical protein [Helicobacter sp. T3_23-1056]
MTTTHCHTKGACAKYQKKKKNKICKQTQFCNITRFCTKQKSFGYFGDLRNLNMIIMESRNIATKILSLRALQRNAWQSIC